ncbi:MAG TPA: sulfatase-like hydrolase/transferase [Chitinophagales bacterium]|nr:sulfatase-like hydrolase/transferase [Chitinophagales bacterium]
MLKPAIVLGLLLSVFSVWAQQKPNVVIILADDLDAMVTPQFFPEVLPVLDSLKKTGIDFTNSFTPMSICCPSRAALLSGKYGHKTDVLRNGNTRGGWKYFKDDEPQALPAQLAKAGYRTSMVGKYLNGYKQKKGKELSLPYGWTDGAVMVSKPLPIYRGYNYELMVWNGAANTHDSAWSSATRQIETHGQNESDYSTDVITNKAIEFIANAEADDKRPFFLYLTPTPPHFPLPPAPRHQQRASQRWLNDTMPKGPNYFNDYGKLATEKEKIKPLDKSSWHTNNWAKRLRQQNKGKGWYKMAFGSKLPKQLKGFMDATWYYRMGSLYALNDMITGVIKTLKDKGEWDNTLLIFTSDNGFHLGSKGLYHKGTPYEEAIRVPLIITGGDSLHLHAPGKKEEWIINLDLMPTLLQLAGVPVPADVDGKSILPLLTNAKDTYQPRRDFVMEYISPGGTDFIFGGPTMNLKLLPSPLLDRPSYNAIRMVAEVEENGKRVQKTFKYIEWEKNYGLVKLRKNLVNKNSKLWTRINAGNKTALRKKAKAEAVETELYDLTADPYEMDNLLYYLPAKYQQLAAEMKAKLHDTISQK